MLRDFSIRICTVAGTRDEREPPDSVLGPDQGLGCRVGVGTQEHPDLRRAYALSLRNGEGATEAAPELGAEGQEGTAPCWLALEPHCCVKKTASAGA